MAEPTHFAIAHGRFTEKGLVFAGELTRALISGIESSCRGKVVTGCLPQ
jgi:hypothetical protein